MANGHGGYRPGAGRKPKPQHYIQTAAIVEDKLVGALPTLIEKLYHRAVECNDMQAARYLCDRALGRVSTRSIFTEPEEEEVSRSSLVDDIMASYRK